jgi:Flp pilus assembly protein TadB
MVPVTSLVLPIILSAVFVFVASAIMHMVLPFHRGDNKKVPGQDDVQEALRKFNIPPGDYMLPRPDSMKDMKEPAFKEKFTKGPVLVMTVFPPGQMGMGKQLVQWFFYCVLISVFAAYVAGRALGPGSPYLSVHRFAGVTAFCAYALGQWQDSIWYRRSWGTTMKYTIDGLIFAGLVGGTFGWLWPK